MKLEEGASFPSFACIRALLHRCIKVSTWNKLEFVSRGAPILPGSEIAFFRRGSNGASPTRLAHGIIALPPATRRCPLLPWIMVTQWTWPICYLPLVRIRTIRNAGAVELGLHRLNEQWDSPETCGEKQSLNARPYNRNRVSLNRARGRTVYTTRSAESFAFRSHKSFLRGSFSIRT